MINNRIEKLCSTEEIFNQNKEPYVNALNRAGYENFQFSFGSSNKKIGTEHVGIRNRKRNVTYYNPPYSKNVKTKVGQTMLYLIRKHFPSDYPLHKILNRNTIKVSYCCMPNMKYLISRSNQKKLRDAEATITPNVSSKKSIT